MAKAGSISLVVPGLFDPFDGIDARALPKLPALSLLLGRAGHGAIPAHASDESFLQSLFFPDAVLPQSLPIAAIRWLNDFGQLPEFPVICADPVYLRPDKTQLRLFGLDQVNHDSAQLGRLVTLLNQEYAAESFHFIAGKNLHWYLCLDSPVNVETTSLSQVLGQNVAGMLPDGVEAGWLKNLFNEIQMILHNQAHSNDQLGKQYGPNSVWFYGAGPLPKSEQSVASQLYSNDAIARGMAKHATIKNCDCPENAVELGAVHDDVFIVLTDLQRAASYGDFNRWISCLLELEDRWFQPLLKQLKNRQIRRLSIYNKSGYKYTISNYNIMQIWRKDLELLTVSRRCLK